MTAKCYLSSFGSIVALRECVTSQMSKLFVSDLCYAPTFICEEPVQAQAHGKAVLLGDFSGKKGMRCLIYKAVFIRF